MSPGKLAASHTHPLYPHWFQWNSESPPHGKIWWKVSSLPRTLNPMRTLSHSLFLFVLLLTACSGNGSQDGTSDTGMEEESGEEAAAPVMEEKKPQDRNGPC